MFKDLLLTKENTTYFDCLLRSVTLTFPKTRVRYNLKGRVINSQHKQLFRLNLLLYRYKWCNIKKVRFTATTHIKSFEKIEPVLLWQKSFHFRENICSVFHGVLDFNDGIRILWT